jgi:DNA-directed RNA polymerase specialized sigma24 family protein
MGTPPFQVLLDTHGRDVHRFLIATVGRGEADDCYQETWLAALRAYPRLRDTSNLRAWVFRIAHNKAIDHLRGRSRRPVAVPDVAEVAEVAGRSTVAAGRAGAVAATVADPRQAAGHLDPDGPWGRVAGLPPKQRAALALRFITDASYAEIAGAMDTSEEAARRNVFEGLRRLRKEISS